MDKAKYGDKQYANPTGRYDADSPLDEEPTPKGQSAGMFDKSLVNAVCQEMMKKMKGKGQMSSDARSFANFARKFSISNVNLVDKNEAMIEWIVDSGATDHMVTNDCLLSHIVKLAKPIYVGLPYGSIRL